MTVRLRGATTLFRNVRFVDRARLERSGRELVRRIVERTQSGVSAIGARFVSYSPAYAKQKGVGVTDVTLTASGRMLDELDVTDVTDRGFRVGWKDAALAERAAALETAPGRERIFLALEDEWIDDFVNELADNIVIGK